MNSREFSFRDHADHFDDHIEKSIPGYLDLLNRCAALAPRFVQRRSTVMDLGCATGGLLPLLREAASDRNGVRYVGVEIERKFQRQWEQHRADDLDYLVADVLELPIENASLVTSIFTIQFLPEADKLPLLRRIYEGLLPGGALIVAEKVLASSGRIQDALTFPYYDFKRLSFPDEQILLKERQLRGQMTCWTEDELQSALRLVGFREVQTVWVNFPFSALLAVKSPIGEHG